MPERIPHHKEEHSFTLIELIVATAILNRAFGTGLSHWREFRSRVKKERELRHALRQMRDEIDRYKDAADRAAFQIKVGFRKDNPLDLDTLVPIDPMTNTTDWGLRANQDEPDSDSWSGDNVFDVYTKSNGPRWTEPRTRTGEAVSQPT